MMDNKISAVISSTLFCVFPTASVSQAVRDQCAMGNCGGGDLRWFWVLAIVWIATLALFNLFWGSNEEKRDSVDFFISTFKGIGLFVGIPASVFFVWGGKVGNGGEAAVIAFFIILVVFMFSEAPARWIFGDRDD